MTTSIVDPDNGGGTDYTSLNAWEGQNRDLVTATDNEIADCRSSGGSADTTATTITGWSTSATYDIEILSNETHNGQWDTSKYRLEVTDGTCLTNYEDFVNIINIQFDAIRSSSGGTTCINLGNQNNSDVDAVNNIGQCIVRTTGSDNTGYAIVQGAGFNLLTVNIYSTIVYGWGGSGGIPSALRINFSGCTMNIYNCVFTDCDYGVYHQSSTAFNLYNTAVFNLVDDFIFSSAPDVLQYCIGDDTEFDSGTGNIGMDGTSTDWDAAFTDYSTNDYTLVSSGTAEGVGTDDPSSGLYSNDILDNAFTSTWSIGAHAKVGGGGRTTKNTRAYPLGVNLGMNRISSKILNK